MTNEPSRKRSGAGAFFFVMLVAALAGFGFFLFGKSLLLFQASPAYEQELPVWRFFAEMLRTGNLSTYYLPLGLGRSVPAMQSVLLDPFALPAVLAGAMGNDNTLVQMLAPMQALRVVCAALSMWYFLSAFVPGRFSRGVAAACYGFSICLLCGPGGHTAAATAAVLLPWLLGCVAHARQSRKSMAALAFALGLAAVWSVYHATLMLVVCLVYAVVHGLILMRADNKKNVFSWWGRLLLGIVCGLAAAGAMVLPVLGANGILAALTSGFVAAGGAVSLWFMVLPVPAVGLAVLLTQALDQKRFKAVFVWPAAVVLVVLVAVLTRWAEMGPRIAGISATAGLVLATGLVQVVQYTENEFAIASRKRALAILVVVAVAVFVLAPQWFDTAAIEKSSFAYSLEQGHSITEIAQRYRAFEPPFWRMEYVEETSASQPDNKQSATYRGIDCRGATRSSALVAFQRDFLGVQNTAAGASYAQGQMGPVYDDVLADLYGLRYVVADRPTQSAAWVQEDNTDTGFYVYRNASVNTAGLLYPGWCTPDEFDALDTVQRQALPAHSVLLEGGVPADAPRMAEVPTQCISNAMDVSFSGREQVSIDLAQNQTEECQQAFIKLCAKAQEDDTLVIGAQAGVDVWPLVEISLDAGEECEIVVKLPVDANEALFSVEGGAQVVLSEIDIVASDGRAYSDDSEGDDLVYFDNPAMGGSLPGTVRSDAGGILVLPVPYEAAWSVSIDGEETTVYRAFRAFLAVEVPPGEHEVVFDYRMSGLVPGIAASAVGALVFIALLVWALRKKKDTST